MERLEGELKRAQDQCKELHPKVKVRPSGRQLASFASIVGFNHFYFLLNCQDLEQQLRQALDDKTRFKMQADRAQDQLSDKMRHVDQLQQVGGRGHGQGVEPSHKAHAFLFRNWM